MISVVHQDVYKHETYDLPWFFLSCKDLTNETSFLEQLIGLYILDVSWKEWMIRSFFNKQIQDTQRKKSRAIRKPSSRFCGSNGFFSGEKLHSDDCCFAVGFGSSFLYL